jgi:hypothetical protein
MTRKGRKATPQEAEAGQRNLQTWLADHPERGNLRHGAYSRNVRRRYSDKRTIEGRQIATIMQGLADDLGGSNELTSAQRLLLDNIRSKLIVLFQIGAFVDKQESIINPAGELLPCLGRNYTTYAESLRRDLEALSAISRKPQAPDLQKYLSQNYGKDKR